MTKTSHRLCVYSGFACIVLFLLGFWAIAGFAPPPSPGDSAHATAEMFREHTTSIRTGLIICVLASALIGPWVVGISVHLKQIEGRHSPMAYLQLGFGMLLTLEFLFPIMFWQTATYRSERSDELIQLLNDMGWIPFVSLTTTGVIQACAIGIAILGDHRERPHFPRWCGYFNFWVALSVAGGTFAVYFKGGPLAWSGLLGWWVPLTAFGIWLGVMGVLMLKHEALMVHAVNDDVLSLPTLAAEVAEMQRKLDLVSTPHR